MQDSGSVALCDAYMLDEDPGVGEGAGRSDDEPADYLKQLIGVMGPVEVLDKPPSHEEIVGSPAARPEAKKVDADASLSATALAKRQSMPPTPAAPTPDPEHLEEILEEERKEKARVDAQLRRLCQKKANGTLEVPVEIYEKFLAGGTGRAELKDLLMRCRMDKANMDNSYACMGLACGHANCDMHGVVASMCIHVRLAHGYHAHHVHVLHDMPMQGPHMKTCQEQI